MSSFHSTISRRTFMKGLGLAGAGLGTAAAAAPVFHDLDEVISAPLAVHNYPWWARGVDECTTEIDWGKMQPYDAREMTFNSGGILGPSGKTGSALGNQWMDDHFGAEQVQGWSDDKTARGESYIREGKAGYTLRDLALNSGRSAWGSPYDREHGFLGMQTAQTPDDRGLPKWTGTSEEAARMLRVFMRYVGAAEVSFVKLDPSTSRKLIYAYDFGDGKAHEWADVAEPEETATKRVFPNSYTSVITIGIHEGHQTKKRNRGSMRYPYGRFIQFAIQEFLRGLGYQGLGPYRYTNNMSANVGLSVLGGMGELGRNNMLIYPLLGALHGVASSIVTNLDIEPTKPVDAGIHRFCYTCKTCASLCPANELPALSMETEPTYETVGPWNHFGYKHWWYTPGACRLFGDVDPCNALHGCQKWCPFSKDPRASIHRLTSAAISTTSLFNGFFAAMDDVFGYSTYDESVVEDFWKLDLPIMGIDSTIGVGGY